MNKNTKSTTRTKKALAKATKTHATKTAAKTTKSKTVKSAATKPRTTKTRATKTRTRKAKESSLPEELPRDKSPESSDDESSDNETYDKPDQSGRSSGLSTDSILDMAAMLRRKAQLEKLRQYYYSHKDKIHEKQNSKYPTRRVKEKNNLELIEKRRQASRNYYQQNKDKILPKIKKRYVEKVIKEKGLEICPTCGKTMKPATKRGE